MRGDEMADYGEQGQSAGVPAEMGAERAAEEPARLAWAKPVVRRFSLRKTLSGSGAAFDGGDPSGSHSPFF